MAKTAATTSPAQITDEQFPWMPGSLPGMPTAARRRKVERVLMAGIQLSTDPDDLLKHDEETARAIADAVVDPESVVAQLARPRPVTTRFGTLFVVSAQVVAARLVTNIYNPRPVAKRAIDADMPWSVTDLSVDPQHAARVLVAGADDLDELSDRLLETDRLVLGEQKKIASLVWQEGVQEPLFLSPARYEIQNVARAVALRPDDGNSRLTAGHTALREWLGQNGAALLRKRHARRRTALTELIAAIERGIAPLSVVDDQAWRDLYSDIAELCSIPTTAAARSIAHRVVNTTVMPANILVGFKPDGDGTVLEATRQVAFNQHHPDRAATQWDSAATHASVRDVIVSRLGESRDLTEGQVTLLGPRFETVETVDPSLPAGPDDRAYFAIRLLNGDAACCYAARRILAQTIGKKQTRIRDRAAVLAAIIGEQIESMSPSEHNAVESALNNFLEYGIFGGSSSTPPADVMPVKDRLDHALGELRSNAALDRNSYRLELGLRGGVALIALGALRREHGAEHNQRPGPIVETMLEREDGLELLAKALKAWRRGRTVRDIDTETGASIPNTVLKPQTVVAIFGVAPTTPIETVEAQLHEVRSFAAVILDRVKKLGERDDVSREGAPPDLVAEVLDKLDDASSDLRLLARQYERFHAKHVAPVEDGPDDDDDEDDEA